MQSAGEVSCVDLSAKENERCAEMNAAEGFSEDQIWINGARGRFGKRLTRRNATSSRGSWLAGHSTESMS